MLVPCEEFIERNGISGMSFEEQIAFKNKVCEKIKYYEDNRYTPSS